MVWQKASKCALSTAVQVCRAAAATAPVTVLPTHRRNTIRVAGVPARPVRSCVRPCVCECQTDPRRYVGTYVCVPRRRIHTPRPPPQQPATPGGPDHASRAGGRGCTVALLQAISGGCGRSGYESREDSGVMHQCRGRRLCRGAGPSRVQGLPTL